MEVVGFSVGVDDAHNEQVQAGEEGSRRDGASFEVFS